MVSPTRELPRQRADGVVVSQPENGTGADRGLQSALLAQQDIGEFWLEALYYEYELEAGFTEHCRASFLLQIAGWMRQPRPATSMILAPFTFHYCA